MRKLILALVLAVCAWGQTITTDNDSNSGAFQTLAGSTLTWTHTITSNSGFTLVVGVAWGINPISSAPINSVTCGSLTLTSADGAAGASGNSLIEVFSGTGAVSTGSCTVTVTFGTTGVKALGYAHSMNGVYQTTPVDVHGAATVTSSSSVGASISLTTTVANDVMVAMVVEGVSSCGSGGGALTLMAGTSIGSCQPVVNEAAWMAYSGSLSVGSNSMGWKYSSGNTQAMIALAFQPAPITYTLAATPPAISVSKTGVVISLTTNATWTPGTPGTPTIGVSGPSGTSKTAQTIATATTGTVTLTTGSTTGTVTITDPGTSAATSVLVESLSVSPTSAAAGVATSITLTGGNTVWTVNPPNFAISGVAGAVLQGVVIVSNISATATVIMPQATPGTATITDSYSTASVSFTGTSAAPTITVGPTCVANSSSSLLCTWSTSQLANAQVSCVPTAGGTTVATPVLYDYTYGTGWGQTSFTIPATGLLSATAYTCTVTSANASGSASQAAASASTSAAVAAIQPTVVSVSEPTRFNDQFSGLNGMTSTGLFGDGDTIYGTWTPTGWVAGCEDCMGYMANASGNFVFSQFTTTGSTAPLHVSDFLSPTRIASSYVQGVTAPFGAHWDKLGLISVRGNIYWHLIQNSGSPHCCGTWNIWKTPDSFVHSIAPSSNTGPNTIAAAGFDTPPVVTASVTAASRTSTTVTLTTTLNPPAGAFVQVAGTGCTVGTADGDYVLTSWSSTQVQYTTTASGGSCTPSSATIKYMKSMGQLWTYGPPAMPIEICQDNGGANGTTYPCAWTANDDGWVYWYGYYDALYRVRVENLPLQRIGDWQCFSGTQGSADLSDASWTPFYNTSTGTTAAACTGLTGGPFAMASTLNYKLSGSYLPDFHGFIVTVYAPVNNTFAAAQAGASVYWLSNAGGTSYPWGTPVLIGSIDVSPFHTTEVTGFPQIITPTYTTISTNPVQAGVVYATGGGLFAGSRTGATDSYSIYFRNVTFGAASAASPPRPKASSNSRNSHTANGLRLYYNFKGTTGDFMLSNRSPGACNATSTKPSDCDYAATYPTNPLLYDRYGLINFGQPSSDLADGITWNGRTSIGLATPYTEALTSWTVGVVWGHVPYQVGSTVINAAASAEVVINKSGDVLVSRNGTAASWNVTVNGTTLGAVSLTDGAFGALLITCAGGQAAAYLSGAVGSSLPLTPTVGPTSVGTCTWGSGALTLGDGTHSLYGVLSNLLVWNRALTDAEKIHEMAVIRSDMTPRGITIP